MSRFAVTPNYKRIQNNLVTVDDNPETDLPAVDETIMKGLPEKIFVQALSANTESIFVGPTGVQSDGTDAVLELAAGQGEFLPNHLVDDWKMICESGGMKALVSYFQGVF